MSYNILGINPFHNGSACVLSDGEIIYFLEEERLSRRKYDANPFKVILDVLKRFKIDEVVIAGINMNDKKLAYTIEDPFYCLIRKFYPKLKCTYVSDYHHLVHNYHSYFNSGFENSLSIVIDSGGSFVSNKGIEMDSIYECSPIKSKPLYKHHLPPLNSKKSTNVGGSYVIVTYSLGFKQNEEGKTMGLSSYGNYNPKIPNLFKGNLSDTNIIWEQPNSERIRISQLNPSIKPPSKPSNSKNYTQYEKDLAWKIQNDTQNVVKEYIIKYTEKTGIKNIVCSGGYFLNCVANYYLTKELPHINFYFEPIAHDGGTAIGAAYWRWKELNPNFTSQKQKTLYYGPKYSKEELLKGIKQYL